VTITSDAGAPAATWKAFEVALVKLYAPVEVKVRK
jgi:hypothetical protein